MAQLLLSVMVVLLCGRAARAQYNLVSDDASLTRALRNAMPGSKIFIRPGDYKGGLYVTAKGTRDKPVVIEGDAANPPRIRGGTNCIHLSGASFVTVRNLHLSSATGNGINIDDGGTGERAVGIVVEGLLVEDIGPKGNCDGIKLSGLKDFAVRDCTVSGWGGNAIDLVGCSDGVIERCIIRGKDGFKPSTGPQLKGGTSNVTVRHCLFEGNVGRAINAGGSTGMDFFRPKDATWEAKDLTIEHNLFIGGETPVAFVGIDGGVFRRNTIINPDRWVMRILQETKDQRFNRCRNVTFERNLIVYTQALRTTVNIGPETRPETFKFAHNWWYCSDAPGNKPQLPTPEKQGVYGKDPKLERSKDGWITPRVQEAQDFGAGPPSP